MTPFGVSMRAAAALFRNEARDRRSEALLIERADPGLASKLRRLAFQLDETSSYIESRVEDRKIPTTREGGEIK